MKVKIEETNNGFVVTTEGGIRNNGQYVFRGVDLLEMLKFVAKALFDKNFDIKEK